MHRDINISFTTFSGCSFRNRKTNSTYLGFLLQKGEFPNPKSFSIYNILYIECITVVLLLELLLACLVYWCLTPTLAIFQLYRGVNKMCY